MAIANRISEPEYRELALSDPGHLYELWEGLPREKPLMSVKHDDVASRLGFALSDRLDRRIYRVNINGGKTRCSATTYYMPDVVVILFALQMPFIDDPLALNAYADPLPLIVEVWSWTEKPYDFAAKLAGYRQRGDEEIWYIHPYERTLTAWRRQPDGRYTEEIYHGGAVPVASLPGVTIDLDALLDG